MPPAAESEPPDTRARILDAAATLIAAGGVAALTTRAVAAAAGVQAPTLYRLFGDKRGLLDAVAEHGLAGYVAGKQAGVPHSDPVQDLTAAWDAHVAFALQHPAVFAIMNEVGRAGSPSPAALAGMAVLRERVRRVAQAGRLRLSETRAVLLILAAANGTVTTLLSTPPEARDPALSATAREAVMTALTGGVEGATNHVARLAIGLHAHLDTVEALSPGERLLMAELLQRIVS